MDATSLPVPGGRAPREAGETVPFTSGALDERLGRIDPGHAPGAHRAASGAGHARIRARRRCGYPGRPDPRSEEHTSELQSRRDLVCRLLLEKKKKTKLLYIPQKKKHLKIKKTH